MSTDNGFLMNFILSMLMKKIIVPSDFHGQVSAVKTMLQDDVSGLVDSLTDFAVESASVEFNVETDNDNFTKLLKKWLDLINREYVGIPTGINPLAEEYFKERWKSSSFPILNIAKWEDIGQGFLVPTRMFFVDGESIHSKKSSDKPVKINNFEYQLGTSSDAPQLVNNVIITKPFGRWFDEYPTPYLIKRGIYHNWKIVQALKNKETEILEQIIPYMLLIKKGTERLAEQDKAVYTDPQLQQIVADLEGALTKFNELDTTKAKSMIRATNFDEELKHLIPDLSTIFAPALFEVAEKGILTGLGFIDVAEGVSSSRRESILNPKAFIEESKKGIKDFRQILKELVFLIMEKNGDHKKFLANDIRITSSPMTSFMTDDFKNHIRNLFDRGKVSAQTAVELIAETDFTIEVKRREQEAKNGIEAVMYPNLTQNREGVSIDIPGESNNIDKNGNEIPDDKTNPVERQNYNQASVEDMDLVGEGLEVASVELEEAGAYVRLRQIEPSKFQSETFRTISLSKKEGIKAVVGRIKGEKITSIQSYLFDNKKWSEKEAKEWVEEHNESTVELVGAPYTQISQLPKSVKDNLSEELQRTFMRVVNQALKRYDNESVAFRTAWSVIRKIGKRDKSGNWVRNTSKVQLTRAMIEDSIEEIESKEIEDAFAIKNLEMNEGKKTLLTKLFGNKAKE